ncbi:hypothetical protein C1J03_21045 [Sulfitobacter sp. SK012]|uniref:phosphate/phosphite/phosphonate ABC transporter substrate-binding protein n=1 Tax=Sulfitobacter sp. SK012 TaxID=1389005 RepID=UPI000E0BB254|nr:PhnD/SsuA/transferrin family substrate-binding protein [Sulfitobacter sp. SK012]AXI48260.1 hypothetical protein C1J03_21045 [Sulfitobacter sp. SK012]
MIANLMMYARPELSEAHARYWALLRTSFADRGIASPETLAQEAEEFSVWRDPALVLSQTCGMPFRTQLQETVTLIGTPDFGLDGCAPGYYNSAIIVREDDLRGDIAEYREARFAYNMAISQSGWAAPYAHLQQHGFWFTKRFESGGHVNSAHAVANGSADIAAVDAQTWALIKRYEPWAEKLRVLEYTQPTPGLPYIAGPNADADTTFDAVAEAIAALIPEDADCLGLKGIVRIPKETYLAVPNPPASAAD